MALTDKEIEQLIEITQECIILRESAGNENNDRYESLRNRLLAVNANARRANRD